MQADFCSYDSGNALWYYILHSHWGTWKGQPAHLLQKKALLFNLSIINNK